MYRTIRAMAVALLAACGHTAVCGQPAQQQLNPSSLYGRDTTQGVYVRDSAVAIEKFAHAERMEHLKEWDKSADVYMEILRSYSDRVVPSQVDRDNKIYQYASVASAVQDRLARWPAEGIAAYNRRYEAQAAELLAAAQNDPAKLHEIYSTYFVTPGAKSAAMRLMSLYFENGEFAAAAWLGDRLLSAHPALGDDRAILIYRTAIAYHLAGAAKLAAGKLDALAAQFPDTTAMVGGKDTALASSLRDVISAAPTTLPGTAGDSWPMAFGSLDRARLAAATALGGAKLFSIELKPSTRSLPGASRREIDRHNQNDRTSGNMTGIMPVIDNGELFFHDNARVYALSLESGTPLPGWAETYSGDRGGQFSINAWSTPRGQQCTLAVTENAVFAVMGMNDPVAAQMTNTQPPRGETRLVCLDRRTGKEKWIASPKLLTDARNLDFIGSPLVVGDSVYVMGRGGKGMQFDDAHVVCLDARTGKPRWASYLCSATSGMWDFSDFSSLFGQSVSHLAYSGGRLYALSNLGAVAAIDAYDGTIVWLNIYPRDVQQPNHALGWNPRPRNLLNTAKPWVFNPVIVSGGKVFALPADGLNVHVYDAASGIEEKRLPTRQFDGAQTMLGVVGDRLILASDNAVFCVNWANFDPEKDQRGNLFWVNGPLKKHGFPDDSIRGRGLVSSDSVYVPTAWGILRIAMKSGKIVETYPAGGAWDEGEGTGNLLITPERLIVAGPDRVTAYTDLQLAMAKLDAAVAAAPDQPEPRLRYAEIMSAAGKWDVAVAKLDEAIAVLGGKGAMPPSAARDRVFNDALSFAARLTRDDMQEHSALIDALLERAAMAAGAPSQQVNYRLTRARLCRTRNDVPTEVQLYQEILADAAMREVSVSAGGEGGTRPAAAVAEDAIDELIRRNGRGIYEALERAAAEQLAAAAGQTDPAGFIAVARQYPNSLVAPKALLAAADACETAGEPRLASQILREILFKHPQDPNRALIIESLARNYLALPNRVEVAIARLAQGARLPGNPRLTRPLKLPDGTTLQDMTLADAEKALRSYNQKSSARALPDIRLPSTEQSARGTRLIGFESEAHGSAVPGITALVLPMREFSRNDRIIAFTKDNRIAAFAVGADKPLFTSDALAAAPRSAAWIGPSLLVWNGTDIAVINGDSGQTVWKAAVGSLPTAQVVDAPDSDSEETVAEIGGDGDAENDAAQGLQIEGRIVVRGQGQVLINRRLQQQLAIQRGQLRVDGAGPQRAERAPADAQAAEQIVHVRPLSDRVIIGTSTGRVVALELGDGRILWQSRVAEQAPTHLLASDDFVVLRAGEETRIQLLVLDTLTGQVLRRQTFLDENGAGRVPINLALAPDGTLVYLMPDGIRGKDLFEPGDRLNFEQSNSRNEPGLAFAGSSLPEHIQIADGRIVVLSDGGAYIRVHSLETGKLLRYLDSEARLATGASNWQVLMRVVGSRVYVSGRRELRSYDLDQPSNAWVSRFPPRTTTLARDLFVTPKHVVVVSEPTGPGGARRPRSASPTSLLLQAVSRADLGGGRESGLLEHDIPLAAPSGINALQPVDGGIYYLTGDQQLHFLRGADRDSE